VNRGGSWNNDPRNCRSANRNRNTPDNRNNNLGFRLAAALISWWTPRETGPAVFLPQPKRFGWANDCLGRLVLLANANARGGPPRASRTSLGNLWSASSPPTFRWPGLPRQSLGVLRHPAVCAFALLAALAQVIALSSGYLDHLSARSSPPTPSGFLGAVRGAVVVQSPFWRPQKASRLEPKRRVPRRLSRLRGLME